ncbi:MAG: DUF2157 domain-containing protein [Bacteroidia bacterium]|nr:DUF2157 domain-containing protein [Bacteroidia bacterium]
MDEANHLYKDGIISKEQLDSITLHEQNKPLSVFWELRTILYLGVLLFTSGVGILIYQNIDTIGHQAILGLIFLSCAGCFYFAYKNRLPYSNEEIKFESPFFDYIILLGCILLGIFVGYLQFQYSIFGTHYGLATLFPTAVFFFCAYYFDHKGILSLGITGLATWAGLAITPLQLLEKNDFSSLNIIFISILLGLAIASMAYYSELKNIKKHFTFSYNNFAINILAVATLAALFEFPLQLLSFLFLVATCFYYIKYAISKQSFLFLLLSVIYAYIGFTYMFFKYIFIVSSELGVVVASFYMMASCAGIVLFFVFYKRILGLKK